MTRPNRRMTSNLGAHSTENVEMLNRVATARLRRDWPRRHWHANGSKVIRNLASVAREARVELELRKDGGDE